MGVFGEIEMGGRGRGGSGRRLGGMGFALSRGEIKKRRRGLVRGGDINVVEESVKRKADVLKGVEVGQVELGEEVALSDGLVQKRTPIPAKSHRR